MKNNNMKNYSYLGYTYLGIPEGWKPLVKNLLVALDGVCRHWWTPRWFMNWLKSSGSHLYVKNRFLCKLHSRLMKEWLSINDIKDKYGSLRIYYYGYGVSETIIDGVIELANDTCEKCGSRDSVETTRPAGWVFTLCRKCREDYDKELKENKNKS